MAIKRFNAFVSEATVSGKAGSGARPNDNTEKDTYEPRPQGEKDFKAKHKMTVTKHPVAGDHQFDGDRAEITEDAEVDAEKDSPWKTCDQDGCDHDHDEDDGEELSEGKVVDQLNNIVKTKSAKKVKFGNGKSETIDMTTASALVNMLTKLKPANAAKAEKMLEKSPEGMFQLVNIAFGGK